MKKKDLTTKKEKDKYLSLENNHWDFNYQFNWVKLVNSRIYRDYLYDWYDRLKKLIRTAGF